MEIYKTLKRQISAVTNNEGQSTSGAKYGGGSGKTWIHPPDVLLNGRVEYTVRLLGSREVAKAKGTDTIRDAIHAIRFQKQVKESETGYSQRQKLQRVDLQINVEGVTVVDSKTKMVLYRYPLQRISFCADDKQDKRVFSFIAKAEESNRHDCFVFMAEKVAEQITLTVGEAFDLAYKNFMDKNRVTLQNQKQVLLLKKRIIDLEEENQALTRLVESYRAQNNTLQANNPLIGTPALPTSPMPPTPPQLPPRTLPSLQNGVNSNEYVISPSTHGASASLGVYTKPTTRNQVSLLEIEPCSPTGSLSSPSGSTAAPPQPQSQPLGAPPAFIAPPPPIVPRRKDLPTSSNVPEIGRRLEGLQLNNVENVFDDNFNPRATEKQKSKEDGPFGDDFLAECLAKGAEGEKQTAEDIEKMISQVDKKLAEMSVGFSSGNLEVGDTGESLGDIDLESEYSAPLGHLQKPQKDNDKQ
ncbi:unnamed protein product, partial [Mesorhabditis belari]|uniref:PID domain-containing protein n=1 Tax=Mesorhabditis belari TaxID=2138241 RepID=A0AAF3J1S4_9BILA